MILVGCDFHSRYQQVASVDTETGDLVVLKVSPDTILRDWKLAGSCEN